MANGQKAELDWSCLIGRVGSDGDIAAFQSLFEHFAPRIKSLMLRAGCPSEEAEEIVQDTMIAVWRKASLFDPTTTGAAAWIFTIMRNQRIDLLRRRARGQRVETDEQAYVPPTYAEPADQLALRQSEVLRVQEAIKKLPPGQSRVIQLSFIEERPHAEIADALELPLGTVKSRIRLAVSKLKTLLEQDQ